MTFITVAVAALLLLAILTNRIYAVIALAILFHLYPYATTGLLLLAGVTFYLYRKYRS